MRGNSHVQFLGEGRSVMAVSYPTASLTRLIKTPPAAMQAGFFMALRKRRRLSEYAGLRIHCLSICRLNA